MFDVITFGSASLDIFISFEKTTLFKRKKGFFLPFGEKIEGTKIYFSSGGGGTNSAATLSAQGLKVAFCGMVGKDLAGKYILEELKKFKISQEFVFQTEKETTNFSIIFLNQGENIILPQRGASGILKFKDLPLSKLKAEWFYLAPLSGGLKRDFLKIISFAKENGIKVLLNPSKYQLETKEIKSGLRKIDILLLNQKEASYLTKIPPWNEKKIIETLNKIVNGIWIMTKGKEGVLVSDKEFLYFAPSLKVKVLDPTGAGDAFGAGFLAELIKTKNIISAIQFASANAASNLKKIGAKSGILKIGEKFKRVKVKKIKI